ncbi:MAG TPA: Rpn family recombination-promoting nuclease/putative transposase, partial [Gammaproteobacteria bacterium]
MTQHDSGYHLLFSHPELVEDLLRNFVPEDWVDQLDFSNMERVNAKFHAEGLDQRDGDVIYRIHYREGDGEIYLYLLLEFQSSPDKWMALRTLVYVGLLYQQLIKEGQLDDNKQLPPVFPLVLYNGDQPWRPALDLQSLMALP